MIFISSLRSINHVNKCVYGCLRFYSQKEVRVRFAPSPTGFMHLGGLRTALYNYLFAKLHKGTFILRIEDTDQSRLVEGAADQLKNDLLWSGIEIDEGPDIGGYFGPYVQSQRLNIYKEQVQKLLQNGSAYYCFCTDRRLDLLRKEALKLQQMPKYDNRCRHLTEEEIMKRLNRNEKCCIRFKLTPNCETFEDLVYGNIAYDVAVNEGDPVIIKSDGFPTYHFANVVDDHFMNISHVLRGVEWQISTTKHILMYRAFQWEPPRFGHLPLLLNSDGTKLSKRQGDIKISHFRDTGILPLALINYITNSGGGFDKDQISGLKPKIYTIDELVKQFKIGKINTHSGKLMPERLLEFNRLELERLFKDEKSLGELVKQVQVMVKKKFEKELQNSILNLDEDYIKFILRWSLNRIYKLSDLVSDKFSFIWIKPKNDYKLDQNLLKTIEKLKDSLQNMDDLQKDSLNAFFKNFAEENNVKYSNLMRNLRALLSGLREGPSVAEMVEILGKENTIDRLQLSRNDQS